MLNTVQDPFKVSIRTRDSVIDLFFSADISIQLIYGVTITNHLCLLSYTYLKKKITIVT